MKTLRRLKPLAALPGNPRVMDLARGNGWAPGRPISLTELLQTLSVAEFGYVITTPSPESLGGSVRLKIRGDGSYEFNIEMYNSGIPNYSFRVVSLLRASNDAVLAWLTTGKVYSKYTPGNSETSDKKTGRFEHLQTHWYEFEAGTFDVKKEYSNGLTEFFTKTFWDNVKFVTASTLLGGPTAIVIYAADMLGELADIHLPGDLGLAGLIAAQGQYFLAGPAGFIPVFIAGAAVAAVAFKRRPLHDDELQEAKAVFKDRLNYGAITITNLSKAKGRNFAMASLDGTVIGAGDNYDNYLATEESRRTMIHELTHAWQVEHSDFRISDCAMSIEKLTVDTERESEKYYAYVPGKPWADYNKEQQASIVGDWYFYKRNSIMREWAERHLERYIRENIQLTM